MGNAQERQIEDESFVDELAPGTELLHGQFTIEKFLNSGGFGITYLAHDSLERKVVIKECFPSSFCHRSRAIVQPRSRAHTAELKSVVDLFVQEARSLAKLEHPNIVGVHQVFEDNATAYMVLDFVEGRDLLDTLEDGDHNLTAPQIKGILKDVLGAVGYIHSQDILHRDISPDNILLDADLRPVLIDFGAAREEATKKSRVLSALRVVKDGYSPQEFYVQGSAQTPSSDLYALGATFYHLIEGDVPPNSQARLAAIAAGEKDTYQPLVDRVKGYDKKFLAAIDKALGILPKDRVQSAQEWLDMMEGNRRMSRVVTPIAPPPSSAAAETVAAEKRQNSKMVPLLGSAAVIAILAVGGLFGTGVLEMPGGSNETEVAAPVAEATESTAAPEEVVAAVEDASPATTESELEVPGPLAEAQQPAVTPVDTNPTFLEIIQGNSNGSATTPPGDTGQTQTAEQAKAILQAEMEAAQLEAELAAAKAEAEAEAARQAEIAAAEAEAQRLAEIVAAEAEAKRQAEIAAAEAEAQRQAEIAAAEAEAQRQAEIAAAEAEAQRQAEIAAAEAEAARLAEIEAAEAEAARQAAIAATETTNVLSAWSLELPFSGEGNSNVIGEVNIVAPAWATPGTKVVAVNGTPVDSIADISSVLRNSTEPNGSALQRVSLMLQPEASGQLVEQTWEFPIVQETALLNGTGFTTRFNGETWTTVVTDAPNLAGEFEVGDELIALMTTSERIEGRTSLQDIVERELANGQTEFSFAVSRGGSMWVVSMTYSGGV